ncbi:MAG: hypothetical protein HY902_19645 [Deltaproteobacteria bacterium]|nr:hypothetical protein [Deltaproteobacteria bacterium]
MKTWKIRSLALAVAVGASLAAQAGLAWDEDTCGSTANPDPNCADPAPLQGSDSHGLVMDHATAHWEATYLMARCVGLPDATARIVAAGDHATDASSAYCGAVAVNQSQGGELYYEGYNCGYEFTPSSPPGAVPAYETAPIRLLYTDRCYTAVKQSGHGEFFHFPYWKWDANGHSYASLVYTRDWAEGKSAKLYDPAEKCDMAPSNSSCDAAMKSQDKSCSWACNDPDQQNCSSKTKCPKICEGKSGWTWPTAYSGSASLSWPASATTDDWVRVGVYLHSLGDYYSHMTCEVYSGQSKSDVGWLVVDPAGQGPTTHTNAFAATSDFAKSCAALPSDATAKAGTISKEMCEAACGFPAHDCEFGPYCFGSRCAQCSAGASWNKVDTDLRGQAVSGLAAVWQFLAKRAGRNELQAEALAYRDTVVWGFGNLSAAKDRQNYVKSLLAVDSAGKRQPCMCADGIYGWQKDSKGGYCCKEDLQNGTCP